MLSINYIVQELNMKKTISSINLEPNLDVLMDVLFPSGYLEIRRLMFALGDCVLQLWEDHYDL